MDYFDSNYPLEYYSIGEKYLFYRDVTNRNFWLPSDGNEQKIYDTYVAKYLPEFKTPSSKQTVKTVKASRSKPGDVGITEAKKAVLAGITETVATEKGVTESKTANQAAAQPRIEADGEGALIYHKNINKEIGIVVAKYDSSQDPEYIGKNYKAITVVFDDGRVVEYILGQKSYFNQKNCAVQYPKRASTVDVDLRTEKGTPRGLSLMEKTGITEADASPNKGVTESSSNRQRKGITETTTQTDRAGITETNAAPNKGVTESPSDRRQKGITESE